MMSVGDDGEVVLITLTRPLVCVQPLAVDRAVLVWLNYKNAYEYWSEQRASLNKVMPLIYYICIFYYFELYYIIGFTVLLLANI